MLQIILSLPTNVSLGGEATMTADFPSKDATVG